ncbi:hypothetical protein ACFYUY_39530 [Kitasatospora sp. NPDC004745]|uniref:hypothetical protein n=1 Tax=Kitasatospora sp. NPDC004745 TaxID=3364019 RepID=UPI0036A4B41D
MTRTARVTSAAVAAATAGALLLSIAPGAQAADNPTRNERAARTVEAATGTSDLARATDAPGAAAAARTQQGDATVTAQAPTDSAGTIRLTAPDGTRAGLGLPQAPGRRAVEGARAGAGTVVYRDASESTDVAVQLTSDGGARAIATLKDSNAPAEQRYELSLPEGTEAVADGSGGYDLIRPVEGGAAVAVGRIDAPWAKDAQGSPVATGYRLEGNTLVQRVDTTEGTAFPVVADPKVTWGIVTGTIYFNRGETRSIALGGGLGATAVAAIPGGITTVVGVTMAAITARAAAAYDRGRCLKIKLPHVYPDHYAGGYCQ